MIVKEVLKFPRECWESTEDMIKLCGQLRKKVHKWVDQKYKQEMMSREEDVETASPKRSRDLLLKIRLLQGSYYIHKKTRTRGNYIP